MTNKIFFTLVALVSILAWAGCAAEEKIVDESRPVLEDSIAETGGITGMDEGLTGEIDSAMKEPVDAAEGESSAPKDKNIDVPGTDANEVADSSLATDTKVSGTDEGPQSGVERKILSESDIDAIEAANVSGGQVPIRTSRDGAPVTSSPLTATSPAAVPGNNLVEDLMPILKPALVEIGVPADEITEITQEIVNLIDEVVTEEEKPEEQQTEEETEEQQMEEQTEEDQPEEEPVEEPVTRRGGGGSSISTPVEETVLLDSQDKLNEIIASGDLSRCDEFSLLPYQESCEIYILANRAKFSGDIAVCEPTDSQFIYDNCVKIVQSL